ncbi:transmembrane protein 199 [Cimex lectularius]|uniref:Transmembrane protein 199 n=1 Tax=Cimex lectularius TaxID=79782 RepID=A0A8I6RWD4_CIMLE|nr:transmembrane protein 199 [Cimex lectularius]XP_024086285.1 transmembrane protein 199 [Cimex lectularius]
MTVSNQDFQLKVTINKQLIEAFNKCMSESEGIPPNIKECMKDKDFAKFQDLEWLFTKTKHETGKFHELITGSEILLPKPAEIPRNPELEARVKRLRAEQDERDYKKMTKNVDNVRVRHPEDSIKYQVDQMNKQLIAVAQFVFSVIAGFVFGFLGIELIVGDLEFGFRLLLGVIFALIIALAEIYFLAKKLAEDLEPLEKPKLKPHMD